MAFDQRFAMVLVGSSGEGGASLYRRNFGEAVENLTGLGEYHWMAGNFLKYGAEESSLGSKPICQTSNTSSSGRTRFKEQRTNNCRMCTTGILARQWIGDEQNCVSKHNSARHE